jgi:hypothetical protein
VYVAPPTGLKLIVIAVPATAVVILPPSPANVTVSPIVTVDGTPASADKVYNDKPTVDSKELMSVVI